MSGSRFGGEVEAAKSRPERGLGIRVDRYETTTAPDAEDRDLVDLVTAVLVDSNLRTDLIMRLHREVSAILRATHEGSLPARRRRARGRRAR
jgi:hypothetical protein